jgi:hypothetical protein
VDQLQLVAFPLPAEAELHFAESPAVRLVLPKSDTSRGFVPYHKLELTPSTPGDYLVLAAVEAWESPGNASVGLRMAFGTERWPVESSEGSREYFGNSLVYHQSYLWARVVRVESSGGTLEIEVDPSVGGGSRLQHARILAVRTDCFDAVHQRTAHEEITVPATGPVELELQLEAAPRPYGVVSLQAVTVTGTAVSKARFEGAMTFTTDHPGFSHEMRAPAGLVDLVSDGAAHSFGNRVLPPPGGGELFAKESFILLLER